MRTVAIIQARMGSNRLPGKVLMPILGKPMLGHIVDRVRTVPSIDQVVVAVPNDGANEVLRRFCADSKITHFAGSETDVLDRYYRAAQQFEADPVIRITADCPIADPQLIEKLIQRYKSCGYDHIGVAAGAGADRIDKGRYPDGLDAECFGFSALDQAWHAATDPRDREHVTRYIWNNKQIFRCGDLTADVVYPKLRLTVDHAEDFALVSKIYESLYSERSPFLLSDVMNFLERNPRLVQVNRKWTEADNYRSVLE
ncbi:MAG: glycosyltransferase family protein [Terriglobales bacterium]|jgi:spore coat polysaccharide biosynthesis protein SpsF